MPGWDPIIAEFDATTTKRDKKGIKEKRNKKD